MHSKLPIAMLGAAAALVLALSPSAALAHHGTTTTTATTCSGRPDPEHAHRRPDQRREPRAACRGSSLAARSASVTTAGWTSGSRASRSRATVRPTTRSRSIDAVLYCGGSWRPTAARSRCRSPAATPGSASTSWSPRPVTTPPS